MRHIHKDPNDIATFNAWAKRNGLAEWPDYSAPDSKYHGHYLTTRDKIAIIEQDCLSAYTERPLGKELHIDHFRKRTLYPQLTFDYANFLVDDLNDNYGACYKDNHAKVTPDTFDGQQCIFSPIMENMADFITFMANGQMIPKSDLNERDKARVDKTIKVFNLNHPTLKSQRYQNIQHVSNYKNASLHEDEIRAILAIHGFPSVVEWALRTDLTP